jgi:hypothetical protein
MAKASETLRHPVLGELRWRPDDSHWATQVGPPAGGRVDVIVDPGDGDRHAFLEPAAKLFAWALKNERRVLRAALRAELLELYNDTWRREGEPVLSAKGLADRLQWSLLVVSAGDVVPVEFGYEAGGLFGGHSVTVEVDEDLRFSDIDLRG